MDILFQQGEHLVARFCDLVQNQSGSEGIQANQGEEGEVTHFEDISPTWRGFHRRYMAGNRACRLWVGMVRELEPAMIVPQHGGYFASPAVVSRFLDWLERLESGPDLLRERDYSLPRKNAISQ